MSLYVASNVAFSGTLSNFTIPAPGALALLGAAGLVGARRRR
jgi:xanthosine utilization system XapX-like protein